LPANIGCIEFGDHSCLRIKKEEHLYIECSSGCGCGLNGFENRLCFLQFGKLAFLAGEIGSHSGDLFLLFADLFKNDLDRRLLDPGLAGGVERQYDGLALQGSTASAFFRVFRRTDGSPKFILFSAAAAVATIAKRKSRLLRDTSIATEECPTRGSQVHLE
jgi:hypothetical protein